MRVRVEEGRRDGEIEGRNRRNVWAQLTVATAGMNQAEVA